MTQADSVHSTPPTNTSANNPTDEALRRLLTVEPMTDDDKLGMAWWNSLTEKERAKWSAVAGNTGRPKDAWEAFKRGSADQPPPDEARRRFLAVAAGASVSSVGTLAVAAMPTTAAPASPVREPGANPADPIYAAIERHRSAASGHDNAVNAEFGFEAQYGGRFEMSEQQLETYWDLQDATGEAFDGLQAASVDLMITKPTTIAGVAALCQHLVPFLSEDDTPAIPLEVKFGSDAKAFAAFCLTIAAALEALIKAQAGKAVRS